MRGKIILKASALAKVKKQQSQFVSWSVDISILSARLLKPNLPVFRLLEPIESTDVYISSVKPGSGL